VPFDFKRVPFDFKRVPFDFKRVPFDFKRVNKGCLLGFLKKWLNFFLTFENLYKKLQKTPF
jgi:hypothetical protein